MFGKIFRQIGSILSKLSAGGAGGAAPPQTPPLLRGAQLEERTVAGTPLCSARDMTIILLQIVELYVSEDKFV